MNAKTLMTTTIAVACTLLIAIAFRSAAGHAAGNAETEPAGLNVAALVPTLHRINQMEIEAGKMAQSKGASQAVKDYGRQLQADHQAAEQALEDYARARRIAVGGAIPATVKKDLDDAKQGIEALQAQSGAEFDRTFAQKMKQDDKKAIDILDRSLARITDYRLEVLLGDLEPTLRADKKTAASILAGMNASAPLSARAAK